MPSSVRTKSIAEERARAQKATLLTVPRVACPVENARVELEADDGEDENGEENEHANLHHGCHGA